MHPSRNDIGSYVKAVAGVAPQVVHDNTSGVVTVNGGWINRQGYESAVLAVKNGAAAGSPSSYSVAAKLQDAADNAGTGAADLAGDAITPITADNGLASVNVNLAPARQWIRVVLTVTFVGGGLSPTLPVDATIVLGGAPELPAT